MAKAKPEGKPTAVPYPKNWSRMTKKEREDWHKVNRPNRPTGVPAKAPTPPKPATELPATGPAPTELPATGPAPTVADVPRIQMHDPRTCVVTMETPNSEPVAFTLADLVEVFLRALYQHKFKLNAAKARAAAEEDVDTEPEF